MKKLMISLSLILVFPLFTTTFQADTYVMVYTDPLDFEIATQELGNPIMIDFEEIDASPLNNTFEGRDEFYGSAYAHQGVIFSNPNNYPLYISPGGLFWNPSNSLSVGRFPFDPYTPYIFENDDDLVVTLDAPCMAVGFTLVDNGNIHTYEFVQFIDYEGNLVEQVVLPPNFTSRRAFVGIVSPDHPIALVNIVEEPNDWDDVNFDDFMFFSLIPTVVDIFPNTVNLKSGGRWIYAYIELPEGYTVEGIDVSTIKLEDAIVATSQPTAIGDYGADGINNLLVKFDRQALFVYLDGVTGEVELTLSGELSNGLHFEGSDTFFVVALGKD